MFGNPQIRHTWLHRRCPVAGIDIEHLIEFGENKQHACIVGHGAARETGAGATGNERHLVVMAKTDDGLHLTHRVRQDDDPRQLAFGGQPVGLVDLESRGFGDDIVAADLAQPRNEGF